MIQALPGYTVAHVLRDDTAFTLLRATRDADGASVLVLVARLGCAAARARLEHEYLLRAELDAAWAAPPQALLCVGEAVSLVLDDAGLDPLYPGSGRPWPAAQVLRLGAALAQALAQLHRRDLVHRDLRPEHILYDGASGRLRLTGFGLAARMGEGGAPHPPGADGEAGSLAYMAPEQSGRMNRALDARTDLYSLGVLLYQLLCGELPFAGADAAQSIQCHVACAPPAPASVCAGADPGCAAIVMKLLAKCPTQRYQSAAGVHADLRHCLDLVEAHGQAAPFALGCNDGAARLQAPQTLVGRARELALLEEAALHVVAGGAPELVMVSGHGGCGKSALLHALQQSDALAGAIVISARFEQHLREVPYATLAQGFQKLVRQLLGQSEASLANWRRALQQALGANAGLMLALIPELSFVIGAQAPPPEVTPVEAEGRLQAVFRQFLGAFTGADSMLVLCLDDLQWIDTASLKLLTHLVTHPGVRGVLVVGAYRQGDIGPGHPLLQTNELLKRQNAPLRHVPLAPLGKPDAAELVAVALDSDSGACAGLAALVYAKTGGNPFFTLQFLARLVESGLLHFDHAADGWRWDAEAIGAREFSDNVVDLMIARLQQLPYDTLELVKLLACLGQDASLVLLAQAAGMSPTEVDECLWPAGRLGLIQRSGGACRFVHDRVQEAAYSLMARASLPERHLHIGRLLLDATAPRELETQVFTLVGHLNRARDAMTEPAELARLARLNVLAGGCARRAVAYDAARHYFDQAAALTPDSAWQSDIDGTFALYSELAECEYLCGRLERADALFALLSMHARTRLEMGRLALMRVALYQVSGRFDLAAAVALEALALFGIRFPEQAGAIDEELAREQASVAQLMAGRSIAELESAEAGGDPELAIVGELFSDMGSSVFSARPALYPLLGLKALNFTLRYGPTAASCTTYSRYAIMLVSNGAIADAFAFSELALRLAARSGSMQRMGRLSFVHGAYIHSWQRPLEASVALLEQAFAACQEAGDLPHAGFAAHIATWNSFEAGLPLADVQQRARTYQGFARQHNNDVLMQLLRCYEQLTLCLQGATAAEGSFDDERFAAADALALMDKASYGAARARFHLMRQVAAFTFGHYGEALQAAEACAADQHFLLASVNEVTHHFYHALALAALYAGVPRELQVRYLDTLQDKLEKLRNWATHCPHNFDSRYLLVAAEVARLTGREMEAMRAYDAALASARQAGFVHNEALAAELAADFHRRRGFDKIALVYARDALAACARWGAFGKMRELERHYPGLVQAVPVPSGTAAASGPAQELMAALRASQAISATLDGEAVAATLLHSAIGQSGAARALLLLPSQGAWRCVAQARSSGGVVQAEAVQRAAIEADLPQALLQFVLRTRETVVLDDAQNSAQFRDDPVIMRERLRSVLCMPLLRHGILEGVLYLDNALAPGLFTPVRLLVLELMAAQAAISINNAALYALLGAEKDEHCRQHEASARKAGFLAAVSENIRAPMASIKGLAGLALREQPSVLRREHVQGIAQAAQGVIDMLGDVLDFNRVEANTMQFEQLPFSPALVVSDAAAESGRCRLLLDPAVPRQVLGDPLRLRQALDKLIQFALAAPEGMVSLALEHEMQAGGLARLRFALHHSGQALAAEESVPLLQPYSDAARTLARQHGVSGLGLAMARELLARMGSQLAFEADAEGGTRCVFTLALPVTEGPAPLAQGAGGSLAVER